MQRASTGQPAGHNEQTVGRVVTGPFGGTGIQLQFCVQIARSSIAFHGTGVNNTPAAAPPANLNRSRRVTSIFIARPFTCDR